MTTLPPTTGSALAATLREVLDLCRDNTAGEVASYIPELAKANAGHFGIAVATLDGHVETVGDADVEFTIQSISKPFVYGMALENHGVEKVLTKIGVEPSGEAFNSIEMDVRGNRPFNPMVNAGAIAAAALIPGQGADARREAMLSMFGRYSGRPHAIDRTVFESERDTGFRNRAIAYLEYSSGMIDQPIDEHLDLYFQQCSVLVTARDLALMAATLANRGVNPVTGERALAADHVKRVVSVMATCGMYDWAGEWLYRVGIPAKSGVGGGIIAVLPGQFGIGIFSPPLDEHGNSVRGIQAAEELARRFNLHLFDSQATSNDIVRRRYDIAAIGSRRHRALAEREQLAEAGQRVAVYELQGDLNFATVELLLRRAEQDMAGVALHSLVLDGRRVGRADRSGLALLCRAAAQMAARGTTLRLAGFSKALEAAIAEAGDGGWPAGCCHDQADGAIEVCEDELLGALAPAAAGDEIGLAAMDVLRDFSEKELATFSTYLERRDYAAGSQIVREGDAADRLYFLAAGSATAQMQLGSERGVRRLRGYAPGVVFGEPALFFTRKRTADVVADGPVVCHELKLDALEELSRKRPDLHAKLLLAVGRNLSELLARATTEIRTLEA